MPSSVQPLESGFGIQVIKPGDEHTFILDEDALTKLLLQDDVKDREVVLVSVAGAYRKGKSFLLDFFLRFLHHTYNLGDSSADWLGSEEQPLKGFGWRGGSERHTTGMLLWSQPFKTTLPDGTKVVILLLDTQGTFDNESTARENATVFALSTMISSVQIYNLSQNLREDDLQHLQFFADYGKLAQERGSEISAEKPFQRLLFLIRDWSCWYQYPYGSEGGEKLLTKLLQVRESQHEELKSLRKYIHSVFEELACFLMPHPGLNVSTNPEFDGKLADIEADFKKHLKQLVLMLLSPKNLVPKRMNGQPIKAKDLLTYFKVYMKVFNGNMLPEPKSLLAATAEANNLSAMSAAKDVYGKWMEEECGGARPYLQPLQLHEHHWSGQQKALHAFRAHNKLGGKQLADKYEANLIEDIEDMFEQWKAINNSKNLCRIIETPVTFALLAMMGYLVSVLGEVLGLETLSALGQAVAVVSIIVCGVWFYTRWTGNLRGFGSKMDNVANAIKNYILSQAVYSGSSRVDEEVVESRRVTKKHS